MILKYQTGEQIKNGDRVLFHGEPAEVEFVADGSDDPNIDPYHREYGDGVMIAEPKVFGRAFIPASQLDETEDFEFVSRAHSPSQNSK